MLQDDFNVSTSDWASLSHSGRTVLNKKAQEKSIVSKAVKAIKRPAAPASRKGNSVKIQNEFQSGSDVITLSGRRSWR